MSKTRKTKPAITTKLIKMGLLCPYNGEVFDADAILNALPKIIEEGGYKMTVRQAAKAVGSFSDRKKAEAEAKGY